MYQNILLHIPHASTLIPESLGDCLSSAYKKMEAESFYLVDYFTDQLFGVDDHPFIRKIVAPHHRMLVDMERLINDPLENHGFGIVSQRASDWLGERYKKTALKEYTSYHERAGKILNALRDPLVIDCHSFSSHSTPLCKSPVDVDICIGWNKDWTEPAYAVKQLIKTFFEQRGYSVAVNKPFSNSITFLHSEALSYGSVMIEVNKRCYMNEETLEKTEGFDRLHKELQDLYESILRLKSDREALYNKPCMMCCEGYDPSSRLFHRYARFIELAPMELHYALRIVHRELEKKLNMSLTDDEFIGLFLNIKEERFLHPAGPWSGVGMMNVYNGPFDRRARINKDEKRLKEISERGGWRITPEACTCHSFFRESFKNFEKEE